MLLELFIKNLALIDEARVQFGRGLNILTGETGAGKTVVVGAVNLLLGGRADASLIRRGCNRAEVQGLFTIPAGLRNNQAEERINDLIEGEDQVIIRRVLSIDGKNKCYINDRMVTVGLLSEIGRYLVDLHSQHEHQSLFKTSTHVDFLDKYGGTELLGLRAEFSKKSNRLKRLREEFAALKGAERELLSKKDLLRFQINEIDEAGLVPGEDGELGKERVVLNNAEKLYAAVARAANALADDGVAQTATLLVAQAVSGLNAVSNIDAELDQLCGRLRSILIDLEDCTANLRNYAENLDFPPGRLQEIEDRLALISLLKRKYGSTIEDILSFRKTAADELLLCDTSGDRLEKLQSEIIKSEEELAELGLRQSAARKEAALALAGEVKKELADLNMPNAKFEVSFMREQDDGGLSVAEERVKIFPYGIDKIEFLVSANKGEPAMPLVKIASGGELSRIMLALKIVLADADEVPSLIFDEVDAGVGGKTAFEIGKKMSLLAGKHQVLSVTHLPQIASFADQHINILKREIEERTVTEIEELLGKDRISELARMLSGNIDSDVSLKHAEELIIEAQKSKHGLINGAIQ